MKSKLYKFSNFNFKIFALMLLVCNILSAQTTKLQIIDKPEKSTSEIVAVRDANGRFCAGIQVISDLGGFSYDAYNGVVKVDKKPGKDMVYIQSSERVLEIYLSGYEPLKIILSEIGIQLNEKDVWIIKITGDAKLIDIPINIITQPEGATVFIDGKRLGSGKNFQVAKGKHTLRLTMDGYRTISKQIEVSESSNLFEYTLEEVEPVMVTLKTNPAGATIFIDDVEEGQTNKQLFKFPGEYNLRISKSKYENIEQIINVSESGNNTWSFNLVKTTAILTVNSKPEDAEIYVNGERKTTKYIEVSPGRYRIEVKKNGWYSDSKTITVEKGQDQSQTFTLKQMTGKLQMVVEPMETRVVMKQGNRQIDSWSGSKYKKNIPVGQYTLQFTASGYAEQKKTINIEENKKETLNIKMEKRSAASGSAGDMVFVKGGTFQMGCNSGIDDEKPAHTVTISDFYISKYEVNNEEYIEFLNNVGVSSDGSYKGNKLIDIDNSGCPIGYRKRKFYFKGSKYSSDKKCPVIEVTWYGANEYCKWRGGRLPTEAEWEFAARGGNQSSDYGYSGSNYIEDVAWYYLNSGNMTHPVGNKNPNKLGIYDMSGNVWEWCWDWYGSYSPSSQTNPKGSSSGIYRVLRGGGWNSNSRVFDRGRGLWINPFNCDNFIGFRVAKDK